MGRSVVSTRPSPDGVNRVKQPPFSSAPRDWAPEDRVAGWGEGKAGSGRVGGDREQSPWEVGGHCGAPGTLQRRHRRRLPSLCRPDTRPWAARPGLCFPRTPEAGPGGDSPSTVSATRFKKEEREKQLWDLQPGTRQKTRYSGSLPQWGLRTNWGDQSWHSREARRAGLAPNP